MLSLLLWLILFPTAMAGPFVTVEYSPLSRGDVTWIAEEQTSGLLVGEFDGFVNPTLKTHLGAWLTSSFGVSGSLGIARMQTTTWFDDDSFRQAHWGVVRPGLDLRYAPFTSRQPLPLIWLTAGGYLDIASSRDTSNVYTESEQELATQTATEHVNRLKGMGTRIGFGIEKEVIAGLSFGVLSSLILHRSVVFTETTRTASSWTTGDASLLITFAWPHPTLPPPDSDPENSEGILRPATSDSTSSSP